MGAVSGGAAWAVLPGGGPVAVGAGVAVGAAVWIAKSVTAALTQKRPAGGEMLPIKGRSPEEGWLRRAQRAVDSFDDLSRGNRPGPIAEKCAAIGGQAATTLEGMHRLAGQTSAVAESLRRVDAPRLLEERTRIKSTLAQSTSPKVSAELERSLEAMNEQLEVHDRLRDAHSTLLARMQSTAISIEGLVARLAEVLAMSEGSSTYTDETGRIDELADEMEGLRLGMAETESLSARALSQFEPDDSVTPGIEKKGRG